MPNTYLIGPELEDKVRRNIIFLGHDDRAGIELDKGLGRQNYVRSHL